MREIKIKNCAYIHIYTYIYAYTLYTHIYMYAYKNDKYTHMKITARKYIKLLIVAMTG